MTDTILLKEKIKESGYKIHYVAKFAGLSYQGLLNKMNNISDFRAGEITKLCTLLHINAEEKEKIFFASVLPKIAT